jgi:hypothetical protein
VAFCGKEADPEPEEQNFIMAMHQTWEDARTETRANDVLTVLRVRGIVVPAAARKRILAQKDLKQLERWLKKAVVAKSIEDVIDKRS